MTFLTILTALGILLAGAIVAVGCLLVAVCRNTRTPDDEFPRSKWKGKE